MIALLRIEFRKLRTQKSILSLFLIIFMVHIGLLAYQQTTQPIPISAYDQLQEDLMKLSNEERYTYVKTQNEYFEASSILEQLQALHIDPIGNKDMIAYLKTQYPDLEKKYGQVVRKLTPRYTNSRELEARLFQEVYEEFQVLHSYHEALQEIQAKATSIASVSIFASKTSFSNRNILKSAKDFQAMNSLEPIYQIQKPIVDALDSPHTDFLIVLMAIGIVSAMILDEKHKGLLTLLKTTRRGDLHTMIAKCIVMMLSMGIVCVILYGSNIILMNALCRFGDLFAPIISLCDYSFTTLPYSILTFFFIFLGTKWMSICVIGGLMLCSAIGSKHKLGCFLTILACLGLEWLLYLICDLQGPFAILKQLNLISFLDTASLYARYTNLNLFGTPVTYHICVLWLLVFLIVLFAFAQCVIYHKKQDVRLHQVSYPTWIQKLTQKHSPSTLLLIQESYKVMWIQKGCFLLLGYLCFIGFTYHNQHTLRSQEEKTWAQYTSQLEQKTPQEVDQFFQAQQAYFDSLHKRIDDIESQYQQEQLTRIEYDQLIAPLDLQLSGEQSFQAIQDRYTYVLEDPHRVFLNPYGYERYFMQEDTWMLPFIILLIMFILMLSDLVCMDYQNDVSHLLSTTRLGRTKLIHYKLNVAFCVGIVLMIITITPILYTNIQAYDMTNFQASASSLPQYSHLPSFLSFFALFLFDLVLKCFSCIAVTGTLLYLSHRIQHMRAVLCLLSLIFLAPLFLHMMGFSLTDSFSLFPLFTSTVQLAQENVTPLCSALLIYFLLGSFTIYHTFRYINPKK